jgi:hypothetical protein
VAKVDAFLAAAKQSRHPLEAFVAIPQFQMVLVNAHFELQADVLAADGIGVSLHTDDAVGLHRHQDRSAGATTLCRQRAQRRDFFTKPFCSLVVATAGQLTYKGHVIIRIGEITAAAKTQRLVQDVLEVTMR